MYLTAVLLLILLPLRLSAEHCTTDDDCIIIKCPAGSPALCQRPEGATVTDNGLCTCTDAANGGFHRIAKERIDARKHGSHFYPTHLFPYSTATNDGDKNKKALPTAKDTLATISDAPSRARRSVSEFDRDRLKCTLGGYEITARVCDGILDCTNGLDEKNCYNRTCPNILSVHCDLGLCYDIEKRCDGEQDCYDNSDETNCDNIACPDSFFRCNSGQCIFYLYECDLKPDCSDESDEFNCQQNDPTCAEGDYMCSSGACLRRPIVCDSLLNNTFYQDDFIPCPDKIEAISCAGYNCCDPNHAKCNSGHCIDWKLWCNVQLDCADGSDESLCGNHTCPDSEYFQCKTGQCIDRVKWCDMLSNCPDGSDETACEQLTCVSPDYEFQCKSGHCIPSIVRCDNRLDCPDGSDELNCDNYTVCQMLNYRCSPDKCYSIGDHCSKNGVCPQRVGYRVTNCAHSTSTSSCSPDCALKCPDGFFTCRSGDCVIYHVTCNGRNDCLDKSDEADSLCSSKICPQGYYRCSNGECMSRMFICEYMYSYAYGREHTYSAYADYYEGDYYVHDYVYNADVYSSCSEVFNNVTCDDYTCIHKRAFQCNSGHCVETDNKCNSWVDCPDGSDESSCDTCVDASFFQCKSGQCIPGKNRCNAALDCLDGSDEMNCTSANISCPPFFYRCKSGQCFAPKYQCDGRNYCPDRSDEEHCLNATCPDNYFRCISGQCVPYYARCNGNRDCKDKSDEVDCPDMYCPDNYYRCSDGRCISLTFICDAFFWVSKSKVCYDDFKYVSCDNYTCLNMDHSRCKNGRCISPGFKCDGTKHCTDGSDEAADCCPFPCANGECVTDTIAVCDRRKDCSDWSDELNCNKSACSSSEYQCKTGHCISLTVDLCNGYYHDDISSNWRCPIYIDDEKYCPFLKCPSNYLRMPTGNCRMTAGYDITCSKSKISERCPRNCPDDISYFQCCNCQCVHRVSICDGINDCTDGADERNCGIPNCRDDQFYCGTINCFPLEFRCDGFAHCLDEHDETNCTLIQTETFAEDTTTGPDKFDQLIDNKELCVDPSICFKAKKICDYQLEPECEKITDDTCFLLCQTPCTCTNVGIIRCNQWSENMTLQTDLNILWPFNTSSRIYIANYGDDKQVQWFFTFETMAEISITYASLTRVPTRLLSCAFNIHHLNLSNNAITTVAAGDFGRLYRLSVLDLSNNMISAIEDFSFKGIRVLHLRLHKNVITKFGINLFSDMAADGTIKTDEYRFCCIRPTYFPEQNCYPNADQFSSCKDLMKSPILSVMLWIVGLASLLGNVGIFLFKVTIDRVSLKRNFGVMVSNLAVADALMGVYLLSIASVDVMYRDIYITKDAEWRNSIGCKLLGMLCTISNEASVLFICLITLDRYLITKYPFRQVQITSFTLYGLSIFIWIIAVAIASTPFIIFPYFKGNYYSKASVCIALPLTTESYDGWEYSFAINVGLNGILFLFVGTGQCLIYQEIKASHTVSLVSTRRNNDMKIARRLMYIALSNFFCWIPIAILGILAAAGVVISPDVYAWVTVFVLPINSALNPFLYTLISMFGQIKCGWDISRVFRSVYDAASTATVPR